MILNIVSILCIFIYITKIPEHQNTIYKPQLNQDLFDSVTYKNKVLQ